MLNQIEIWRSSHNLEFFAMFFILFLTNLGNMAESVTLWNKDILIREYRCHEGVYLAQ